METGKTTNANASDDRRAGRKSPQGDRSAPVLPPGGTSPVRGSHSVTTGPVRMTLLVLALPVLAEQLLNTFVGLFDIFLAGRISAAATSAIGLAAYVDWLASMIMMLVATGTTALISRSAGAGKHDDANHFANQSMTLAALLGVTVFGLIYALAPILARYCNMTGNEFEMTVQYLQTGAVGHLLLSLTLVGCAALRGVGNMRKPMLIFAAINAVNVVASLTLVYGFGPVPAMGIQGIVGGTVIARTVGAFLIVIVLIRDRSGLALTWRRLPLTRAVASRILRIGIPAAADGATLWLGHFIFLRIIANLAEQPLGRAYFAAHIIAIRVEAFTYLPAMAWAAATATMIGQSLGAGDLQRAKRTGHEGVLQCGLLSVFIACCFFFGASSIFEMMSKDELVRAEGVGPFRILALLQPLLVISIVYIGGLRGAGDTRFPLLITICGALMVRLPLGYYFGIVLNGGLLGAWMGMFGDMAWRAFASTLRFVRGKWLTTQV
ncbi:MAG: MATE family efflux transporter [Planctomycetes bacterium]|nr:MATE family efflux transporter [Planctomycetota bacterium]